MKWFFTSFCLVFFLTTYAQSYRISGNILDKESRPLTGANIILSTPTDSVFRATITSNDGAYLLENIPQGRYQMKISFIGYKTQWKRIFVKENIKFDPILLLEDEVNLSEIEVVEQTVIAVQREDTTEFNANAFKTNPDANADDLLKKMPGITSNNGTLQAQGENIKEVLVDGKPFFGKDPNAALKALPAEVIEKIQIFDQESEQAQLTGVSDGETSKTINIITKSNMKQGEFGKVYVGYGYENRYQAGGNINLFKDKQRISVIGQTNNINQQNFSNDDLLGLLGSSGRGRRGGGRGQWGGGGNAGDFLVPSQNGISNTHAFGINYSDEWGEKVELTGSYFFNLSDNDARQNLARTFLNDATDFDQIYHETDSSASRNINHRLNFRLDYEIDDYKTLTISPSLSIQQNEGSQNILGQNVAGASLLNQTNYTFTSNLTGIDFDTRIAYRQRFEKRGRSFSISLNSGYRNSNGNAALRSENTFFNNIILSDTIDQNSDLLENGWNASARVMYTEPLSEKSVLYVDYNASLQRTLSDRKTNDFNPETQDYTEANTTLSNEFNSDYLTQRAGLGFRYGDRRTLMTAAGLGVQWSQLTNELIFPNTSNLTRTFYNLIPFAMVRYNISKMENLRFFYRVNTNPPSIANLQNVVNNSDPLRLELGNPDLDQQVSHRLILSYKKTDTDKSSFFYASLSTQFRENYIADQTFIARQDTLIAEGVTLARGGQLIQPVNLDGYLNAGAFLTYGKPIKAIKSNLNLNLSANFTRLPGLINGVENTSDNRTLSLGVTLSSNVSENIDFTIGTTSSVNDVQNTANGFANAQFFNQKTTGVINLIKNKWVFRTDVSHQFFTGLTDGFNQNFFLWNVSFGRKFLKNDRGDLRFTVFDLLNQNTSITRNVTTAYLEDVETVILQRFIMLTFTYNIRHFGTPPKEAPRKGRGDWQ